MEKWESYANKHALRRFDRTVKNLELNMETKNFIQAFHVIRRYIVKRKMYDFTQFREMHVIDMVWNDKIKGPLVRGNNKYNSGKPEFVVVVARVLAEINLLLHTSVTMADLDLVHKEPVLCIECGKEAEFTEGKKGPAGKEVSAMLYVFPGCGAFCGTHDGTNIPLGAPANEQTRKYRLLLHRIFDSKWAGGHEARNNAYIWLAEQMGMPLKYCHFALFDIRRCRKALAILLKNKVFFKDY